MSEQLYALVFANGSLIDGAAVHAALARTGPRLVIAADGGLKHAERLGLRADVLIGDLDSVPSDLLAAAQQSGTTVIRHRVEKDETDLELALVEAAARGATVIRVLGAIGSRFDHTLSNIYLLTLPALHGLDVRLVDGAQTIWLLQPGAHTFEGAAGDTLSLVPLAGDAVGLRSDGLYYPLRGETLRFGPARGTSNVLTTGSARLEFTDGLLLAIHIAGRAE